jgi:hypothetical protein
MVVNVIELKQNTTSNSTPVCADALQIEHVLTLELAIEKLQLDEPAPPRPQPIERDDDDGGLPEVRTSSAKRGSRRLRPS